MEALKLFLISALPVIVIAYYIYKKDKNKEPQKLLLKLFLGGIGSCFLVIMVSLFLQIFPIFRTDQTELNSFELFIHVFIGIALVEEVCKWIMAYYISFNDKEHEEIYDTIIYTTFVALGFAFFENLLYVFQEGIEVGIMRAITAVPGHACDGVVMGYFLGKAKQHALNNKNKLKRKYITLSIIIPTLTHGFYDYCLFIDNEFFILLFLAFVVLLYIIAIKIVKKTSKITKKLKYKNNYCTSCGQPVNSNFCRNCGNKNT